MTSVQSNNRLEFLDSLRGLAMLFVIYFHFLAYSTEPTSVVNDIVIRWRMPLFFFISGFFATFKNYDKVLYKKRIINRITKQLYPTIVVWAIFIFFSWVIGHASFREYLLHGIYDPAKRGYWFTTSLVEVYLLYSIVSVILFALNVNFKKQGLVYLALAAVTGVVYIVYLKSFSPEGLILKFYSVLSIEKFSALIPFFFLGVFCRTYEESFFKVLGSLITGVVAVLSFSVLVLLSMEHSQIDSIVYYCSRIFGLVAVVSIFVCGKRYLDSTTAIGRYLIRIGRNTLPIYLFHFFLIILVPYLMTDFLLYKNALQLYWYIELPCVLFISALIAEICMFVDGIIKRYPRGYNVVFNPLNC